MNFFVLDFSTIGPDLLNKATVALDVMQRAASLTIFTQNPDSVKDHVGCDFITSISPSIFPKTHLPIPQNTESYFPVTTFSRLLNVSSGDNS